MMVFSALRVARKVNDKEQAKIPERTSPLESDQRVELSAMTAAQDASPGLRELSLTDFLDIETLQDIQDSFSTVTRLKTVIRDAIGQPLTVPTDTRRRAQSDLVLEQLIDAEEDDKGRFIAPIVVEGQQLGSIAIEKHALPATTIEDKKRFKASVDKLNVPAEILDLLAQQAEESYGPNKAAGIQFLYLLANSIARLCYEEYYARKRLDELSVLYKISTMLSGYRDLQQVLESAVKSVGEVMKVKAASIRLLNEDTDELISRAVYNLSNMYLSKDSIKLSDNDLFRKALAGEIVYMADMHSDPHVCYRGDAGRDKLVSMLCIGMNYQGKPIGTLQLFTDRTRQFKENEIKLLRAISHLLAAAIENARLDYQRQENQRMLRQLQLAADVQRRMLPHNMPRKPPFDIAARYVPSFELGGDFYDFIDLGGHIGISIGDVAGKGIAASLLMAGVRMSLRAFAQDVYDIDEIVSRVNITMTRDTLDSEFATLWYGVFNPSTLRLTYCNAGHEPPMLLHNNKIYTLGTGGMIVGIDPNETYEKGLWDLHPNDMILLYTDGLTDAINPEQEKFGRSRIEQAIREAADYNANDALNHILLQLRRFTGLRRAIDDTTLVVIKVADNPGES